MILRLAISVEHRLVTDRRTQHYGIYHDSMALCGTNAKVVENGEDGMEPMETLQVLLVPFCVSRRRREMYCGHARLCLSAAVRPHYCTDPDVTWGHGRGCPLVVHYWVDLQSGHGLRCYGNITQTLVTSLRPSRNMTT